MKVRTLLAASIAVALPGCAGAPAPGTGDAEAGRLLLQQYGCGTCHRIPGVVAADGRVGPPLDRLGRRVYLAGRLPNTPEQLAAFIRDPQRHVADTTMPDLSVGARHAEDMAAYLGTLR